MSGAGRAVIAEVAGEAARFTDWSVPDAGIREIYATDSVWQAWLDVEAALAEAQATLGLVPEEAARAIVENATMAALDRERVIASMRVQGHPVMPLIEELSRVVGPAAGGWVHWGATSQNITQSGNALLLRRAHALLLAQGHRILGALASLAERSAEMIMPGRTHGQHAVPITFGLKAATWIEDVLGGLERIEHGVRPCLRVMMGGAAGSFASLGERGPRVQELVARRLGLEVMPVPSRALLSPQSGYIADLAVLSAAGARIALEVETMMQTEFGEVSEPVPSGSVGSSTMPHKRNPKLSADVIELSAHVRGLVPVALTATIHPHEADGGATATLENVTKAALVGLGDLLERTAIIVEGLELFPERMRANLQASGRLLASEAVMLALGGEIGRDAAHHLVYGIAMRAATESEDFARLLLGDERVTGVLGGDRVRELLAPEHHVGLSAELAREAARRARAAIESA